MYPRVMRSAAKMNIGTAVRTAGVTPPIICWTSSEGSTGARKTTTSTSAALSSGTIMGKPAANNSTRMATTTAITSCSRRKPHPLRGRRTRGFRPRWRCE